jgi:hypothetical protein
MLLGAASGVYVRLVAECLVHTGSMCFGALPFADQNLNHGLVLMIDFLKGHTSVLISLQVSVSLCQDSCSLFTVVFGRGIFPLVALLVSCLCWSERWSLRPTASDDNLFFTEVREC